VGRRPLLVEPVFEVGSGYSPLTSELDRGESAAAKLAGHDKCGYVHVLADVGDGEPFLWQVDCDAFHVSVLPDRYICPKLGHRAGFVASVTL